LNQIRSRGDKSCEKPSRAIDRAGVGVQGTNGGAMHIRGLWLDCDLASLAVLLVGICAVSLLALSVA
jgi:hypothetical protein